MEDATNSTNVILNGDCLDIMPTLPQGKFNVIFADPPYNLQLKKHLHRPDNSKVKGVNEDWDSFASFEEYDKFSIKWLSLAQHLLKPNGTIWVMGSYHNIFRLGKIMQDLGFWILNQITWVKANPLPNFKGTRFTNSQETIIWAKKNQEGSYPFFYQRMKSLNDDKQMGSVWYLPICSGKERVKDNKVTAHPTQKPLSLLYRIIMASTAEGELILDPFFGTGTTGVAAKMLNRNYVGIELSEKYINYAQTRIDQATEFPKKLMGEYTPKHIKVSLGNLIEYELLEVGSELVNIDQKHKAIVCSDGTVLYKSKNFNLSKLTLELAEAKTSIWDYWQVEFNSKKIPLKELKQKALIILGYC